MNGTWEWPQTTRSAALARARREGGRPQLRAVDGDVEQEDSHHGPGSGARSDRDGVGQARGPCVDVPANGDDRRELRQAVEDAKIADV